MFQLANDQLRVAVLDPAQDAGLLGPRFCAGAYVWQVSDAGGPLLSGPEGPVSAPDPFNGQGLPEAFRDRTREGVPLTWEAGRGLAPGAGILARDTNHQVIIVDPCRWEISRHQDRLTFETEQRDGERGYRLSRMLQLVDRQLLSVTRFSNTGRVPLALQWFAHPFFALDERGLITVQLPAGTHLPENAGFRLDGGSLTMKRRFTGQHDGHFELLDWPADTPLDIRLSHPRLAQISFSTSFLPSECPVWANGHTFSIEPYQTLQLEPVETRHWTLRYEFGRPTA